MVGIDLEEVKTFFGEDYNQYLLQQAQKYLADELLTIEENHLKVTRKGKFLSDGIASDLFRVDDLI
jgi:putative coproporphyrinogen dehydrogenase